ncbi:MAG: hypothetical protein PHT25_04865 [Bacteroidales bacterium]|nr:hypothetical protein [Bacteroidales bacterium]
MILKELFITGGPLFMTILTLELILLILAAWKAPAWVKEIGLIALISCWIFTFISLIQMFSVIQRVGDISISVWCGGFKVALIPVVYGSSIYLISLILRIIQKPRI